MITLAERVKAARKRLGMSQRELAEKLNVKQQTISKLESGRSKGTYNLAALSRALDVTADWLLSGKDLDPEKMPAQPSGNKKSDLDELFDKLPRTQQEAVVDLMRSMLSKQP